MEKMSIYLDHGDELVIVTIKISNKPLLALIQIKTLEIESIAHNKYWHYCFCLAPQKVKTVQSLLVQYEKINKSCTSLVDLLRKFRYSKIRSIDHYLYRDIVLLCYRDKYLMAKK